MEILRQRHEQLPTTPIPYEQRSVRNNLYSIHDNRYSLRNDIESLGKPGLGKRKFVGKSLSQHESVDLISWKLRSSKSMSDVKPTTLSMFRPVTDPTILTATFKAPQNMLTKYHTLTKSHFHRYPHRHYPPPPSQAKLRPPTQTTDWSTDSTTVTPLWVMAATQRPYMARNNWKYSYKFR